METTVTKLKGEVFNSKLKILGSDGNIYSNYFGRYINGMSSVGYTLSDTEKKYLNAFVESGVTNGWIEYVGCLYPFIGNREHPKSGFVPLIDNINNYYITSEDVTGTLFSYDNNNKIKCLGRGTTPGQTIITNLSSDQFKKTNAISFYLNVGYAAGDEVNGVCANILGIYNTENDAICAYMRKGDLSNNGLMFDVKTGSTSSNYDSYPIPGAQVISSDLPYNTSVFYARYVEDSSVYYKKFIQKSNDTGEWSESTSSHPMPYPEKTYFKLGNTQTAKIIGCDVNILAFMYPTIDEGTMTIFNNNVKTLLNNLGRI